MRRLENIEMVQSAYLLCTCLRRMARTVTERLSEVLSDRVRNLSELTSLKLPELRNGDIRYIAEALIQIIVTAYIFYENVLFAILLSPYVIWHVRECRAASEKRKKTAAAEEFKDGIIAVSFALGVGYSIENAFAEAVKELTQMYGADSQVVKRFSRIVRRLNRNENLEDILDEYADESGIEDISYFTEVFRYAKRSGGDLISIIRNTASVIQQKVEVSNEIETALGGKRMEQKVMSMIPFGIILYLKVTASEFISPLYGNVLGVAVMTVCLIVYVLADRWAKKIVDIKV